MIPETADALELLYTSLAALGVLAVVALLFRIGPDVVKTYRAQDWEGLVMSGAHLLICIYSLGKSLIMLGIGGFAMGQPPAVGELSQGALLIRAGLVAMDVLIVLSPWTLFAARWWIDRRK